MLTLYSPTAPKSASSNSLRTGVSPILPSPPRAQLNLPPPTAENLEAIGIEAPVVKEPEPKAPKKPAGTKRKAKEPPLGEPLPTRRSSRSAVIHQSAEEKAKAAQVSCPSRAGEREETRVTTKGADARLDRPQEEKEREEFEAAEKRRRKHDPRQVEVLSSVTGAADQASLMATFAELTSRWANHEKDWFVGQPAPKWPDRKSVEKLKTELGDVMEHRGTIKVTSRLCSDRRARC